MRHLGMLSPGALSRLVLTDSQQREEVEYIIAKEGKECA